MELKPIKCANCGAQLEIDLDNIITFCPYCGSKLMIETDQLGRIISEKEETKRQFIHEANKTIRSKNKLDFEERDRKNSLKYCYIGIAVCFGFMLLLMIRQDKRHDKTEKYLKNLETEIESAIKEEDYDTALLEANRLHCDDDFSEEEKATWDDKRESLINIIEEKKREAALNDSDTIFIPSSSSSFIGKNYNDIIDQFKAMGFTDVTAQPSTETPGLFKKKESVEHILIGGKTEFSSDDYFKNDTPIIVYYYVK